MAGPLGRPVWRLLPPSLFIHVQPFFQFLKHTTLIPTSGCLHLQFPLSGILSPHVFMWLASFWITDWGHSSNVVFSDHPVLGRLCSFLSPLYYSWPVLLLQITCSLLFHLFVFFLYHLPPLKQKLLEDKALICLILPCPLGLRQYLAHRRYSLK